MLQAAALLGPFALSASAADPALADTILSPAQVQHIAASYGESWIYFRGSTAQLSSLVAGSYRLKPGMAPHPPHSHPDEELMVITEGTGELTIEGKPTQVAPGSMMFCAADHTHGLLNTGKTPLTFYFWKWRK
jgi:mannose-6-phosphate isomerase-like protein (cupin superfamily)